MDYDDYDDETAHPAFGLPVIFFSRVLDAALVAALVGGLLDGIRAGKDVAVALVAVWLLGHLLAPRGRALPPKTHGMPSVVEAAMVLLLARVISAAGLILTAALVLT